MDMLTRLSMELNSDKVKVRHKFYRGNKIEIVGTNLVVIVNDNQYSVITYNKTYHYKTMSRCINKIKKELEGLA